jgi:hypothetical protein
MKRPFLLALVAALLALGLLAGCGGDDDNGNGGDDASAQKEAFDEAYGPINDDLLKTGNDVGTTINTARGKTNAELAVAFRALAARADAIKEKLDALEAPEEYKEDQQALSASVEVVARDLEEISDAARLGQANEARTQTQELVRHSVAVRTARRELARKTGATVEGGGS